MQKSFSHCFALCAYKINLHLEDCVKSLLDQSLQTKIIMITATPNDHICGIAQKYNLPLFVNPTPRGMAGNWNYAYKMADTDFVTIAHEDDIYDADFASCVAQSIAKQASPLLIFTDYCELFNDKIIQNNKLLAIKRKMNAPLSKKALQKSRFIRNRILSLGCSICCPSVTYNKAILFDFEFSQDFLCNLDWDAWYRISKKKGAFIYIPKPLMCHRIHEQSETTRLLENGKRFEEDLQLFKRYWPTFIAKMIMKKYSKSADSNQKSV